MTADAAADAAVGSTPRPVAAWARVALVHSWVLQFRRGFHDALRQELASCGIELLLVHGFPHGQLTSKEDAISVPWARHVENRVMRLGHRELLWTPARVEMRDADLVIVSQQSKQLTGYETFLRQRLGRLRMAYWGHGKNFDEEGQSGFGELVKREMSRRVHWWFAYTGRTARVVRGLGFPQERITVVENAIDTRKLIHDAESLEASEVEALREELGIEGANVGLFVGGMYPLKRLSYLIEACDIIRARVPDFHMIFLGGGPDRPLIDAAAERRPWMHVAGPTFGREKVRHFALAKVVLMPGLVGLAILDTFALGTPLVTVADSAHSPEIDYLIPGQNGIMLAAGSDPAEYGDTVVRLLEDDEELRLLREGTLRSRDRYTIENMAGRFAEGIQQALLAERGIPCRP